MSRGFDWFELDDSRDSGVDSGREIGGSSSSNWNEWLSRQNVRREEERRDHLDRQGRDRSGKERPLRPREERLETILAQRVRTRYFHREKEYSLRDSEIHLLSEVGKFRVVAVNDLAELAYNGDRARVVNDIENLSRQGLVKRTGIADPDHNLTQVLTLTKEGHKLLSRGKVVSSSQALYHGLKKPKEAFHDADLYRLYHKAADEIESRGGRIIRVRLDYELKRELYSRLARASRDKSRAPERVREQVAERFHLKTVSGKIPIPDLRIEYTKENDNQIQRLDLELVTEHYRPQGLSEKARAGFQIYARRCETDRLRRIRDDLDLTTAILRL
jgi:hypothetical protein